MRLAVQHNLLIVNWCDWEKKKKVEQALCFVFIRASSHPRWLAGHLGVVCCVAVGVFWQRHQLVTHSCKRELFPSCCCSHTHRCCLNTGTNAATLNLSTLEIGSHTHTQGFAACRVLVPTRDDSLMSQLAFTIMDQRWCYTVTNYGWTVEIERQK